jgi:hypothetical protein
MKAFSMFGPAEEALSRYLSSGDMETKHLADVGKPQDENRILIKGRQVVCKLVMVIAVAVYYCNMDDRRWTQVKRAVKACGGSLLRVPPHFFGLRPSFFSHIGIKS